MRPLPESLRAGVFTRHQARKLGVTDRQFDGPALVRVFPRVYRSAEHTMSDSDWINAAMLALPANAHLTGISRIQKLGLDFGPRRPIRFVVAGDLHLRIDGIFLHRTKALPPLDEHGVAPAAAFIAYCSRARVIDAIKVGDWLLHEGHLTLDAVRALALSATWRDGAHEAVWMLDHLDGRSRSLKESETRAILDFAGLPRVEVNAQVDVNEEVVVIGDLVYRPWTVVVEYEGRQHQEDRARYVADLDRYALMRAANVPYVQVTQEKLGHAQTLVGEVYRALLTRGYDGPTPTFGDRWRQLFLPVSTAVGPRLSRIRDRSAG